MQVLLFIALLIIGCTSANPVGKAELQKQIEKKLIRHGIIPPQDDPLTLNDTTLNINSTIFNGQLSIADSIVSGLSLMLDDLRLNLFTLDIDLTITLPQLAIAGQYSVDGILNSPDLGPLAVTGSGAYSGSSRNAVVSGGGRLQVIIITNRVRIVNVRLAAEFQELQINAENTRLNGTLYDWDLFNENVKPIFDETFAKYYNDIVQIVTDSLNEVLSQYTLAELIDLIIGGPGSG